jgi:hypothetical protein
MPAASPLSLSLKIMDKDTEKALWDELRILQAIIDKFDGFSFQIKNWFLTIFAAITGYAVVKTDTTLLWLNFGIIVIFYVYEITYRISHRDFLRRSREIQQCLRENKDVTNDVKAPNLDKYLFPDLNKVSDTKWLYRLQRKFGIAEIRSKRNVREWQTISKEIVRFLFQFRVSLPYIATVIINIIALVLVYRRDP